MSQTTTTTPAAAAASASGAASVLPPLLGGLQEICLVTPDIRATISSLARLGMGPFQIHRFDSGSIAQCTYKGRAAPFSLEVAFYQHGELAIELMQPLEGPSLMRDYLDANGGRAGVQHLAFDMGGGPAGDRIKRLKERGVEVGMSGVWKGKRGDCKFVFFETEGLGMGTTFETIEFSEDWEEPEGEWWPCRPEEVDNGKQTV